MTIIDERRSDPAALCASWVDVCAVDDLPMDRGVAALVGGHAVAVFRTSPDGELHALANIDPYSEASVMSRGIVGSIAGRPVVASPIFKHRFDLQTGASLDDPSVGLATYEVIAVGGRVLVRPTPFAIPNGIPSPRNGGETTA